MYCVGNFVCDAMLLSGQIFHVRVMDGRQDDINMLAE